MRLGTNLAGIGPASQQRPFLNLAKQAQWAGSTTDSSRYPSTGTAFWNYMNVDANGYPTDFNGKVGSAAAGKTFTELDFCLYFAQPSYPLGNYVLVHDGTAQTVTGGAGVNSITSAPVGTYTNRYIVSVTGVNSDGIRVLFHGAGWTNVRFIYSPDSDVSTIGTREGLYNSGEIFNPDFISKITPFKLLRFMDWCDGNGSNEKVWTDRTIPTWISYWGSTVGGGVPIEVMVALANKIGADMWHNMPINASTAYMTSAATLVKNGGTDTAGKVWAGLDSSLKVYSEAGNEWWNANFDYSAGGNGTDAIAAGKVAYPTGLSSDFQYVFQYGILQSVRNAKAWRSVWTGADRSRLISFLGGQSGYVGRNQYILNALASDWGGNASEWSGAAYTQVDGICTAYYINNMDYPEAWTDAATGAPDNGVTLMINQMISGIIPDGSSFVTATAVGGGALGASWTTADMVSGSGPPINGKIVCVNFAQGSGANPTISLNGGTQYPIMDYKGNVQASVGAQKINLIFTDSTSAGAVTAGWRLLALGPTGGDVPFAVSNPLSDYNTITVSPYNVTWNVGPGQLHLYEGGQQMLGHTSPQISLYLATNRDSRMQTVYTNYINGLASSGALSFCHYNDIGENNGSYNWGALESVELTTSPKWQALMNYLGAGKRGGRGLRKF